MGHEEPAGSQGERMKETEAETQQSQGTKPSQCVPKGWVTGSSTFSASAFKRTSEVLTLSVQIQDLHLWSQHT